MEEELLFYLVILISNIIQGITGFAGTILAMPLSLRLVGYGTAVPILNLLGVFAGIYVFLGNRQHVNWKELRKVVCIMGCSIVVGILLERTLRGYQHILYMALGVLVILIALRGFYRVFWLEPALTDELETQPEKRGFTGYNRNFHDTPYEVHKEKYGFWPNVVLVAAGIVHGMYVCGGPLLIGYLTNKTRNKIRFRATISTVWIFLNGIHFVAEILQGMWSMELVRVQLMAVPFLFLGMLIGGMLYRIISQKFFMVLTYVLLMISGVSLFWK